VSVDGASIRGLLDLTGRGALVTGASGGIGAAIVRSLLEAGAHVASVDLPGRDAVPGSFAIEADVAREGACERAVAEARERLGRLDIVVHAAGITRDGVLWKTSDEAWRDVMAVNLDAAFRLLRAGIPVLREGGGGAVILIASINGERGKLGQANYVAAKAGLIGLGKTAAREAGRFGIRVNVIAPGWIDTPMTERLDAAARSRAIDETVLGRAGTPEDVASAVLFLAGPMSGHVTGQVLRVDGGQLIA
jgi:3-oxoacyl-[acyl-carrier protein] reductase